jgi:DNA mismatch repair protein MutS
VLGALEKADGRPKPADLTGDLPLFRAAERAHDPDHGRASRLERAISELSPDAMTPKQALEALYLLKALLAKEP